MSSRASIDTAKGGPARPQTLNRQRVLEEGLTILDREGPAALSMRRLAKELGVSPMALYNHVSGKDDLVRGIVGIVIETVQYRSDDDDWRDRIRVCFGELRKACLEHPGIVRLVETADELPTSIFQPMEVTLTALQQAGLEPQNALRAYCLLINFTMGHVSFEIRGPFRGADPTRAVDERRLPATDFPATYATARFDPAADWDFDASFEFGISTILEGLGGFTRAR
jgi:TetR/AcrR family transcriptional regulator, tetracycline repressor protein